MTVAEQARQFLEWGGMPVPYSKGKKGPTAAGWPQWRFTEADLRTTFDADSNLGLLTGFGHFTDVDLDATETLTLAPQFLPRSRLVHGRASAPESHHWYLTDPALRSAKFRDPLATEEDAMLLELRCLSADGKIGLQTMTPPSRHPNGELLSWAAYHPPEQVDPGVLLRQVKRLAAAALLVRHWPAHGVRHETALALAGTLLRGGWTIAEAEHFLGVVATGAHDEETADRVRTVVDTAARLEQGDPATGLPRLRTLISAGIVEHLEPWLGLERPTTWRPSNNRSTEPWPQPLADAALHGLAGDYVRLIAPQSEADPVALLGQFLVTVGNLVGRGPSIMVESDRHSVTEFVVLVGDTSKGRKGVSAGYVKRLGAEVDPDWRQDCVVSGLSTGEGLIFTVRDPIEALKAIREKGQPPHQELVLVDPGVEDKRLLIHEPEFSRVLRVMLRPENTLSPVLRQAWDGESVLRVMTRTSPLQATNAHISMIGHTNRDEVLRYLDTTELAGGLPNRLTWLAVRRARALPFGGRVHAEAFDQIAARVRKVLETVATLPMPLRWSPEAAEQWIGIYPELSAPKPGLFGAIVARAEAHVLRYACLYTVLDEATVIHPVHLEAAVALWDYAEDSARYIFGSLLGDPTADVILRALRDRRQAGLSRTELHELFGRNRRVEEIDRALAALVSQRLVASTRMETGGRPSERWVAL